MAVAFASLFGAAPAGAQAPPTPLIKRLNELAADIRAARAARCLGPPVFRWHPGYRVPEGKRALVIRQRTVALGRRRRQTSRCIRWPWDALAECESGSRWAYNGPSGFDGGLQFHPSTWSVARRSVPVATRYAYAWQAPAWVQVRVAKAWLARTSWAQWPACARRLGLW